MLFANGDRVPGRVISINGSEDLALVKVDRYAKLPPPLSLGDSKTLQAGQWAIAIGELLELRQTITWESSRVSVARSRSVMKKADNASSKVCCKLQRRINLGDSGGPLIDLDGHVTGINQSVAGGAQGIGFAIPINTIRTDVASMLHDETDAKETDTPNATPQVGIAPPQPQSAASGLSSGGGGGQPEQKRNDQSDRGGDESP